METNKDNKLFAETMNIIPMRDIKTTNGNSGLSSDLSFLTIKQKNKTKPAEIRIISFKKEPKESTIKKPSKTSSKINISFTIENCVRKISNRLKYPICL